MKKALFISSRTLYPLVGGERIRTAQCLRYLAKHYEVDVVCISEDKNFNLGELQEFIQDYKHFHIPKYKHYLYTLRFLSNKKPLQVNYYYSRTVQKYIDKRINKYSAVFCNNIRTAEYVRHAQNAIKYMDFVDSIAMNYERAQKLATGLKKLIYHIDFRRCKQYEIKILQEFNHCSIISEYDKNYILNGIAHQTKDICIIKNAVNIKKQVIRKDSSFPIITFVGKMSYDPNILAVNNFAKNIFPRILEKYPTAQFWIIGANPTDEVKKLCNEHIIVTGYVDDIEEYLLKSTIVVAPMLSGAGIQNKILQAMALKSCVVTTTIGAEGLDATNNDEIVIADGNDKLGLEICKLLSDKKTIEKIGIAAYNFITNNYSNNIIEIQFNKFIENPTLQ